MRSGADHRHLFLITLLALTTALAACKKQPSPTPGEKGPLPPSKAAPAKPTFDTKAATQALTAVPWQGVVGGKAALLIVRSAKGRLVGALMHGKKQSSCTLSIGGNGALSLRTVGRPTQRGLSYMSLGGKFAADLGSVSGTLSHVTKAGFTESSSMDGEFELKKGDAKTAVEFYKSSCEGGNNGGCFALGVAYYKGDGVPKDGAQVVTYFKKACVGGMLQACDNLGLIYHTGQGVPKDPKKVVAYWGKACDDGYLASCRKLGQALIKKNFKKAVGYQKKACDGNLAAGCNSVAWNLAEKGKGKQLDEALAAAQKAVKLDPQAGYIDTLAYVHLRRKEYTRAEMEALRALKLDPNIAEHKQRLVDIRAAMKKAK